MQIDRLHPNEVRLLLSAQKATVEQVSCTLGPHGPVKLATSLRKLLEVLGDYLETHLKSIEGSPDREFETETGMRVFARYIGIINDQYLGYLLPADPYSFPVELLHPMKALLVRFGGYAEKKTSFGLLHWDQFNFRVAGFNNPLRMITNQIKTDLQLDSPLEVEKESSNLPENFVFFTYPQAEGRNILLQGVLFHELGHAIDWKKDISGNLFEAISWSDGDSAIPKVFENWVREIIADLVATRLVGPAILFSSRLAALTVGVLDNDSRTHPSSRFRFLWMLEHLERLGYMEAGTKIKTFEKLRTWYEHLKKKEGEIDTSPEFATVRAVLNEPNLKNTLHSIMEKTVPAPGYDAKKFAAQVPLIVENFKNQLPHCGEGIEPAIHMASVFNAAWETNLQDTPEDKLEPALTADREILCGLALKSIEANHIQRLWTE